MTLDQLWATISATPVSVYLQESAWGFPAVEAAHVLAITTVFGTIAVMDLRLLGVASNRFAVTEMARDTLKLTWAAFGLAVITGSLLFSTQPDVYFGNTAFRWKMLCLVLAGINMLVFERIIVRTIEHWDYQAAVPMAARIAGGLSILFWIAVICFGRWIGFTLR